MVPPLVGRDVQRRAVIDELVAGDRGGVVIAGPAGVGKSRLADEALAEASDCGFEVETLYATISTSTVPFGVFAQLLPRSRTAATRTQLLLESVDAIAGRGAAAPLVLAVDDAHLLDDGSAAVVHAVATRSAARLLLTVRSGVAVSGAITALWKEGRLARVDLTPLDDAAADLLMASFLAGPVDGAARVRLRLLSAGIPLFLLELLRAGLETGSLSPRGGLAVERPDSSRRPSGLNRRCPPRRRDRTAAAPARGRGPGGADWRRRRGPVGRARHA